MPLCVKGFIPLIKELDFFTLKFIAELYQMDRLLDHDDPNHFVTS